MTDWTTAHAVSGPKFVKWLADQGVDNTELSTSKQRSLNRWRSGENAMLYAVDELLTHFGLHISLLPDSMWVESRRYVRPVFEYKTRYCKVCDGRISYREPKSGKSIGKAKYKRKKYCSHECHVVAQRAQAPSKPKPKVDEQAPVLLRRAQDLRKAGLPYPSIAAVLQLDHGVECSADNIRNWVKIGIWNPGRGTRRAA